MGSDQKRGFIAVMLSGLVLFGWQYFFPNKNTITKDVINNESISKNVVDDNSSSKDIDEKIKVNEEVVSNLKTYLIKKGDVEYELSTLLGITDSKNKNTVFSFNEITESKLPLQIQVLNGENINSIDLKEVETSDNLFKGVDNTLGVTVNAFIDDKGFLKLSINSEEAYKYRLMFKSVKKNLSTNQTRYFKIFMDKALKETITDEETFDGKMLWAGIDFNYHFFGFVFPEKKKIYAKTFESGKMIIETINPTKSFNGKLIFIKKNYDDMVALGSNLDQTVDFGFFSILAVPILRGLQFFYKYLKNYGLAIIVLTLFMRMLTFPLQYKSFKSMKKMQILSPELAKIKEKYKDEPQKVQKETMELFKKHGASPLGGCLPMMLQMPVFFAFYQVLYNAVELVNAPFIFWVHDLSVKDPFYVLPALMGVSMFFQSKLNPSTSTDPTQQKVMMFMPIIFTFFMINLPAGLNLYIFVSTLFGILQQVFVYKRTEG